MRKKMLLTNIVSIESIQRHE